MARRHFHPSRCRVCGVTDEEENISQQGFCRKHGEARRDANIEQLENGSGEFYDHWVRRSYMAMRRRSLALDAQLAQDVGSEP